MISEDLFLLENVEFTYPGSNFSLKEINLKISKGEFITILGPNGSGKTTLLKLLSSAEKPTAGKILLKGRLLIDYSRNNLAKIISIVTQFNNITFPVSVFDFVSLGRSPHLNYLGYQNSRDVKIVNESLEKVELLKIANWPITKISGGEFQRALIARALAQEPEIILLDEATAHLDIKHQIEIFKLLENLNNDDRLTIIFVSHNLNLPEFFSKRFLLISNGKIFKDGSPDVAFTPANLKEIFDVDLLITRKGNYSGLLIKK